MTENEAIQFLKGKYPSWGCDEDEYEQAQTAIHALEEIQQYRAIGTVEDIREIYSLCKILQNVVKDYSAIGTIEEFKALKEKNEPKKPLFSTVNRETAYHCGSCKKFVGFYDTRIYEYCHNCGAKIDWS